MKNIWNQWNELLYKIIITKEWALFINIARFLTFILLIIIVYLFWSEIESVKIIGSACDYCMNKTGAVCIPPLK